MDNVSLNKMQLTTNIIILANYNSSLSFFIAINPFLQLKCVMYFNNLKLNVYLKNLKNSKIVKKYKAENVNYLKVRKSSFNRKLFIFSLKYKFNKFSFLLFLYVNKTKTIATSAVNKALTSKFLSKYNLVTTRNWNFLIGSALSPFNWNFSNKKRWLRKSLQYSLFKNFNKAFKKGSVPLKYLPNRYLFKKLVTNNFFYKNKFKMSLFNFNYMIKIKPFTTKKNDKPNLHRPYQFLNNFNYSKSLRCFRNSATIKLFTKFSKLYTNFKKLNNTFRGSNIGPNSFKFLIVNKKPMRKSNINVNKLSNFNIYKFYRGFYRSNLNNPARTNKTFNSYLFKRRNFTKLSKKRRLLRLSTISHFFKHRRTLFNYRLTNKKFLKVNKINMFARISSSLSNSIRLTIFKQNFNILPVFIYNVTFKKPLKSLILSYSCTTKLVILWNAVFKRNRKNNNTIYKNKAPRTLQTSIVYRIYKPLTYFSKEKNNFISNKYGFLFLTSPRSFTNGNNKFLIDLKKTLYSFSSRNEMQRYILKKYSKNNSFINSAASYSNSTNNYDGLKNNHLYNYLYNHKDQQFKFADKSFFSSIANQSVLSSNWAHYRKENFYWAELAEEDLNFNLKRIRFKPGYMNLWREARKVLKLSLNLKLKYQYRLTRYLTKFNKLVRFKTFLVQENTFIAYLLKSKLIPDYNSITIFLDNGLFFINGICCCDSKYRLSVGDFVQLIISIKYYILHRWLSNWNVKKKIRLKNVYRKKFQTRVDYEEKQRSRNVPNWILRNKNLFLDCPNYLETDYFTLSFFILYEPFLWTDINHYNVLDTRYSVINMYNWKYIN